MTYLIDLPKNIKLDFRDLYELWINSKAGSTSKGTLDRLNRAYITYYQSSPFITKDINKLHKAEIEEWLEEKIIENGMNKKAFYNMQTIVKNCLIYAYDN